MQAICGPFMNIESSSYLKHFFNSCGSSNIYYFENSSSFSIYDFRFSYLLNNSLLELENINNLFFVGSNVRMELPLLNIRIRKNYMENNLVNLYSFGLSLDYLTYPVRNLGNSISSITKFLECKFYFNFIIFFTNFININYFNLYNINNVFFFIGMSMLNRIDSSNILLSFIKSFDYLKSYSIYNINTLSRFLGRISACEIGSLNGVSHRNIYKSSLNFTINHYCGTDLEVNKIYLLDNKNINIYQGNFYMNVFMKFI